jgi:hypothetical protein
VAACLSAVAQKVFLFSAVAFPVSWFTLLPSPACVFWTIVNAFAWSSDLDFSADSDLPGNYQLRLAGGIFGNRLYSSGMPGAEGLLEASCGCFLLAIDRLGASFVPLQA